MIADKNKLIKYLEKIRAIAFITITSIMFMKTILSINLKGLQLKS